jgi:hypothetical protein
MKKTRTANFLKTALLCLCGGVAFVALSARATVVTWDLNPTDANASVGSSSKTFTSNGNSITAYGYDTPSTAHELYYKDASGDHGLGLVGTPHNEIQTNNFIQLDISSLLSQGFTNGQIKISSVDTPTNESFSLYGSNTLGSLGTFLNTYGSSSDNQFVDVPSFGTYKFVSVISASGDVLLSAFQASVTPVPEATSLLPTAFLAMAVTAFEARRRRRVTA